MSFGLVEAFSKLESLLEGLKKLPTQLPGRHQRVFDEYILPIHDLMREIHVNYLTIFDSSRNRIRDFEYDLNRSKTNSEILNEIVKNILSERKPLEQKRDMLRVDSQALALSVDIPEMRRYLISICDYFVLDDERGAMYIGGARDAFIESLIRKGGLSAYNTPTTKFVNDIKRKRRLDSAVTALNEMIDILNRKYVSVEIAFQQVKDQRHVF